MPASRASPLLQGLQQVREQYRYFRWCFPEDVLFFQFGQFMECYDIGKPDWPQRLGLKRMGWNRRGARYGFPMHQLGHCLSALLAHGATVLNSVCRFWRYVPVYSS